jgi:hypothetical protein
MTALDKLLHDIGNRPVEELTVEQINEVTKSLNQLKREKKGGADDVLVAKLRAIVKQSGSFDPLRLAYAVVRKEDKIAKAQAAEAELAGLGEEEEEEQEAA